MPYPVGVKPWKIKEFTNAHENFKQPLDENQSYDLFLNDPALKKLSSLDQYSRCTENLQWILQKALEKNFNIRAMGSGWSLSKVAVSDDAIINTKNLRLKFKLNSENFDESFLNSGADPTNYMFLQCGNTIIQINKHLEQQSDPPKSLRVSGGSNGQTVAGAFSTGTHGASIHIGALPEMIMGMHIITGPDRHIYVERSSRRVTSDVFHQKLGAEVIIDDDLFNAALVSFGSFGIIHGVLVEVEDKFLLEQNLRRATFDNAMESSVTEGNFAAIEHILKYPLNDTDHPLYHFELALNPHDFAFNNADKGVYMRTMYKTAYRDDYPRIDMPSDGYTYGDDTLGLMQSVLDGIESAAGFLNRALIPKLVNSLFDLAYDRPADAIGTIGETFNNTKFRGKLFSAAFGINRKDVIKAIDHCLAVNKKTKLVGIMAFRFVKGTKATLGFTKWENSCVLEIDGADASINHKYVKELVETFEKNGVDYTLHWGKINRVLNKARIEKMYGKTKLNEWKRQRSRVMAEEVQRAFNNEFMEQCGLDDFVPFNDSMPV